MSGCQVLKQGVCNLEGTGETISTSSNRTGVSDISSDQRLGPVPGHVAPPRVASYRQTDRHTETHRDTQRHTDTQTRRHADTPLATPATGLQASHNIGAAPCPAAPSEIILIMIIIIMIIVITMIAISSSSSSSSSMIIHIYIYIYICIFVIV